MSFTNVDFFQGRAKIKEICLMPPTQFQDSQNSQTHFQKKYHIKITSEVKIGIADLF